MNDHGASAAAVEAMQRLVTSVPGTRAVLDEHLDENCGEVLTHLLMADLGRWFVNAVATADERGVADFLAAVESLYASEDPDTRNVAEVSFMELLAVAPDAKERAAIEAIRRLAGPKTMADLAHFESAWTDPA
jgi:hypothetical protein